MPSRSRYRCTSIILILLDQYGQETLDRALDKLCMFLNFAGEIVNRNDSIPCFKITVICFKTLKWKIT